MKKEEQSIINILTSYNNEEKTSMLGGMAWDDVGHNIYELQESFNYSNEKLKSLFPYLCKNMF